MKQILLALATLATATQAFAISPRCEKALIEDAISRVLQEYPKAEVNLANAHAVNEAHYYAVRVVIPGALWKPDFLVYYTVQDDAKCRNVKFEQVMYNQADYSLGGSAGGD